MKFKHILLIQPMHEKLKPSARISINFPWGLATLAGAYQRAGYRVTILDGQALQIPKEDLISQIEAHHFDIAGISAFSTQYPAVKLLAAHIKKEHKTPVIVGGPLATYQPELVISSTVTDVCVIGEGELAGVELLESWDRPDQVKGIAFRGDGGKTAFSQPPDRFVDLEQLPLPDFSLFDMNKYLRQQNAYARKQNHGIRAMSVNTSRGCPYNCYFCSKSSQRFRRMSPPKIGALLAALKKEFKVEEISFGDELFLSNKSDFKALLPDLKLLNLPWGGQARVNLMDAEFLEMIKASGCIGLGYGIESGSQEILKNMNKKTTVNQIEFAMTYTQKLKLPIKVQLIFGYPGEDESTVQETIDLFDRVDHPGRRFNVITPIPGSKLYDDSLAQGLIQDEAGYLATIEKSFGVGTVHVNYTQWPDDEIYPRKVAAEEEMKKNYYQKTFLRKAKYKIYQTAKKFR